jgi:hypothetical protein
MENLLEFYKKVLNDINLKVDEKDYVFNPALNNEPTVIYEESTDSYKRLAIPTLNNTLNKTKENLMLISLMPESITKGPNIVLDYIKGKVTLKFNIIINALFTYILKIANTSETHGNLSPDERDVLLKIKDVDSKTLEAFKDIGKLLNDLSATKSFVHLYLKKGIKLYNANNVEQTLMRGCVVTFPFYNELINDTDVIFGKKYRKKDKQIFRNLFEQIFINVNVENKYSKGSNCEVAPYLESLLKVVLNLNDTLDNTIKIFDKTFKSVFNEDFYDEGLNFTFKCKWEESIGNFYMFENQYKEIPIQKESITEVKNTTTNPIVQTYNQPQMMTNVQSGPRIVSPEELAKVISSSANQNNNPFFNQNNFAQQLVPQNTFNNYGANGFNNYGGFVPNI